MKNKIIWKAILILTLIFSLIATTTLFYALWFVDVTQTNTFFVQKILVTIIAILAVIVISILLFLFLKKERKKIFTILIIISLIFTTISVYTYDFIMRLDKSLQNPTEQTVKYEGYLVALTTSDINTLEDLNNHKVGLSFNEENIVLSSAPESFLKDYQIEFVSEYAGANDLLKALEVGEVDAIPLPMNYEEVIQENEAITIDSSNLKVIDKFEQEVKVKYNQGSSLDEPYNIVLVGVDRTFKASDTPDSHFLYDVIVLVTVDAKNSSFSMITVPRDTTVYSDCIRSYDKINHNGSLGINCLTSTLENTFDTTVDYYMMVDFTGVINIVDYLGGVVIDNPHGEIIEQDSKRQSNTVTIPEGENLLNGEQTLAFIRHRKTTNAVVRSSNHIVAIEAILKRALDTIPVNELPEFIGLITDSTMTNYPLTIDNAYTLFSSLEKGAPKINGYTFKGTTGTYFSKYSGMNLSGMFPYLELQNSLTAYIKTMMDGTVSLASTSFNLTDSENFILHSEETNYYDVIGFNGPTHSTTKRNPTQKDDSNKSNPDGTTNPGDAGTTEPGDGGTTEPGDGGTTEPGDGGTTEPGDGGTTEPGDGGTTEPGDGGTTEPGDGGTTEPDGNNPDTGNSDSN